MRGVSAAPRRGRALAACAATLFAAFLAVELLLRFALGNFAALSLVDFSPADGRRVALRPSARVMHNSGLLPPAPVEHEVNSQGFRGPERPLRRPGRGPRIAMIGDSFVFGMSVGEEHTIPAYLQAILKRSDAPEAEVLNFGIPNTEIDDHLEQLRVFASRWQPDLVIVSVEREDFRERLLPASARRTMRIKTWLFQNVYSLRLACRIASSCGFGQAAPVPAPVMKARYSLLARTARGLSGASPVALVVGRIPDIAGLPGREGEEEFRRIMRDCGMPWIDVSTIRLRHNVARGDFHLDPAGSLLAAQRLAAFLRRIGALTPAQPATAKARRPGGGPA
ncbi:MAG: hypothetical protein PHU21_02040 [Elusimicrobia bacterium]|nr:hypothetical protein [Elusimicrobiota bacterium]